MGNDLLYGYGDRVDGLGDLSEMDYYEKGVQATLCLNSKEPAKCIVDTLGVEVCEEYLSKEECEIAKDTADEIIETQNQIEEARLKTEQEDAYNRAVEALDDFGNIDCKDLTDEQKTKLSSELSKYETIFTKLGMTDKFENIVKNFKCTLEKKECTTEEVALPKSNFYEAETTPICKYEPKPNILKKWLLPSGVGIGAGTLTFIATDKITLALPAMLLGFGISKYLLSNKK